jgi:hypothetical protein
MVGGQLTLSMGPARAEVRSYVQRAFPSKKGIHTLNINHKITHVTILIFCIMLCAKKKIHSLLCRLKINHRTENENTCLFLTHGTVQLQTIIRK